MKPISFPAGLALALSCAPLAPTAAFAAIESPSASLAGGPSAAVSAPAAILSADQAERILQRDMALVARCGVGKVTFFLGRAYGEALDSMISVENGAGLRYPVHGGRIERVGEKLSARFEVPESFRLVVDGSQGRLLYAADAKKNAKASCRFY